MLAASTSVVKNICGRCIVIQVPVMELKVSFRIVTKCRAVCCVDGAWHIIQYGKKRPHSVRLIFSLADLQSDDWLRMSFLYFLPFSSVFSPEKKVGLHLRGHRAVCVLVYFRFCTS